MKRGMDGSILPMSTLLPQPTRDALVAASKIESRIDAGECPARIAAVDAAAAQARSAHPHLYRRAA